MVHQYCYYYHATLVANGEWKCRRLPSQLPWQLQVQLQKMTVVIGLLLMDNGNAYNQHATWFLLRDQLLVLCLWDGGFLQGGMENVVLKLLPRCGGRW